MSLKHLKGTALLAIRAARISRNDGTKSRLQREAYRKVAEAMAFELASKGKPHTPGSTTRLAMVLA